MTCTISKIVENDCFLVEKIFCEEKICRFLEAFGVFEGAEIQIFMKDPSKIILKIGERKLALSADIAENIILSKRGVDFSVFVC